MVVPRGWVLGAVVWLVLGALFSVVTGGIWAFLSLWVLSIFNLLLLGRVSLLMIRSVNQSTGIGGALEMLIFFSLKLFCLAAMGYVIYLGREHSLAGILTGAATLVLVPLVGSVAEIWRNSNA